MADAEVDARALTERLLASITHELRNPLQVIRLSTRALERSSALSASERKYLDWIISSSRRMERLVQDAFDFLHHQFGGQLRIQPISCDLSELCERVVAAASAQHPERGIVFLGPRHAVGRWDPVRFQQVVANLVDNAIKYGDPDAPVRVSLELFGGDALLQVRNLGAPIPEDVLPTLFDPFRRAASTQHKPGLGLGLAIVRQIVLATGGAVDVESSPDGGTAFSVVMPEAPPEQASAEP